MHFLFTICFARSIFRMHLSEKTKRNNKTYFLTSSVWCFFFSFKMQNGKSVSALSMWFCIFEIPSIIFFSISLKTTDKCCRVIDMFCFVCLCFAAFYFSWRNWTRKTNNRKHQHDIVKFNLNKREWLILVWIRIKLNAHSLKSLENYALIKTKLSKRDDFCRWQFCFWIFVNNE